MSNPSVDNPGVTKTVTALVTPPGRAALATISVLGPNALNAVAICCQVDAECANRNLKDGKLWLVHWRGRQGEPVVVHAHSSDHLEVNCHGGFMPAETILRDLTAAGAESLTWNELARCGSSTLIEAEALEALARAPTLR